MSNVEIVFLLWPLFGAGLAVGAAYLFVKYT